MSSLLLALALLATACSAEDAKSEPDGGPCGEGRFLVYLRVGCGADAPTPVCAGPTYDACFGGQVCTCDGRTIDALCGPHATQAFRSKGACPTTDAGDGDGGG